MTIDTTRSYEHGTEIHLRDARGNSRLYIMLVRPSTWQRLRFRVALRGGRVKGLVGAGLRGGWTAYFAIRARCNGRPEGYHRFAPLRAGITTNANRVPL